MKNNPFLGKKLRWTFVDGPTAGKTFEHVFGHDGSVSYGMVQDGTVGKMTREKRVEIVQVTDDVWVVSYLASSGYTLTTVLDFDSHKAIAVASNESDHIVQQGTFEIPAAAIDRPELLI